MTCGSKRRHWGRNSPLLFGIGRVPLIIPGPTGHWGVCGCPPFCQTSHSEKRRLTFTCPYFWKNWISWVLIASTEWTLLVSFSEAVNSKETAAVESHMHPSAWTLHWFVLVASVWFPFVHRQATSDHLPPVDVCIGPLQWQSSFSRLINRGHMWSAILKGLH